jgi:hypothetical protein
VRDRHVVYAEPPWGGPECAFKRDDVGEREAGNQASNFTVVDPASLEADGDLGRIAVGPVRLEGGLPPNAGGIQRYIQISCRPAVRSLFDLSLNE